MEVFCEHCRDFKFFNITENSKTKEIKGCFVHYTGKDTHCTDCDNEIYVPSIRDENLLKLEDAYNKAKASK